MSFVVDRRSMMLASLSAAMVTEEQSSSLLDSVPHGRKLMANQATAQTPSNQAVMVMGYHTAGDGGAAIYRRVATEPQHLGKFQESDGGWFELAEPVVRPEMFGAKGDGSDDRAAFQAAIDFIVPRRGRLEIPSRKYGIAGELVIPSQALGFSIQGLGSATLVQLLDNHSHIYFPYEDSAYWKISGVMFEWASNQSAVHRNSYGIRFDSRGNRNYGHRNFQVEDCEFVNGWRGVGVTEQPTDGNRCPMWGAVLQQLRFSQTHAGAAIYFNGFGRTGQPNIAINNIYVRGDAMVEPAIILLNCDNVILSNIEFNKGLNAGIVFSEGRFLAIDGIRFEQCQLSGRDPRLIEISGRTSRAVINGLTLQNSNSASGQVGAGIAIRRGASVLVREVLTVRDTPLPAGVQGNFTLFVPDMVSIVTIDGMAGCCDTSMTLYDPLFTAQVSHIALETVRMVPDAGSFSWIVAQGGALAIMQISDESEETLAGTIFCEIEVQSVGVPLLSRRWQGAGESGVLRFAPRNSNEIVGLKPGDRVRITLLPSGQYSGEAVAIIGRG